MEITLMNTLRTMALLVALGVSGPAAADQATGFFLGAAAGSAELDEDFDGLNVDTDSTSWRLYGGWQFNEYFLLEAGYHDFGDFEQTIDIGGSSADVSLSADGFTFGVGGNLPITRAFSLTGRAGLFFWDGNAQINAVTQASPDDTNLFLGLGAAYRLTDAFSIEADWTRYELEDTDSDVLSAGIRYRFASD